jgi:hypothetical protein
MNHEVAAPMIGDLLHGRLRGETKTEVLSHVTSCGECKSLSETYGLLSEALLDNGLEHPSAEAIVQYAFTEDQLDPDERDRIATHLLGCELCASELEVTSQAEAEILAELSTVKAQDAPRIDRRTRLAPAIAAAVVAIVMAYPAYLGLFEVPRIDNRLASLEAERIGRVAANWTGPVDLNILQSPLRNTGNDPVAIHLAAQQPYVVLTVDPGLLEEYVGTGVVYLDIRDTSRRSIWSWEFTEQQVVGAVNGVVAVLVPADELPAGDLTMSVSRGADRAELVFDAPFRVTRSD